MLSNYAEAAMAGNKVETMYVKHLAECLVHARNSCGRKLLLFITYFTYDFSLYLIVSYLKGR